MPIRTLRLIHTPTPDWDAMVRFYRDVLGLPEAGGWEQPGDRGTFLAAGFGEIEVMEVDAGALGVLPEPGRGWSLALEVDDAEAELRRLETLSVPLARELRTQPWGARDFAVRDPAGNVVLVYSQS